MEPTIVALGVNHTTAPVEVREIFSCRPTEEGKLEELSYLSNLPFVEEVVLLSTCNRVEVYALLKEERFAEDLLEEFIRLKLGRFEEGLKKHFFLKKGHEAVLHILAVPSGLASMVVGETQITAQFKEAFEIARRHGSVGKVLDRLYQFALKTAKRVRSETEISKTPVSVSYIAVLLAKKVFGILEETKVLVVGAGEMAELTARYLKEEKAQIFVTNRTFEKAVKLAKEIGGSVVRWEEFKEFLKEVDIAIFSTSAKDYILTRREVQKLFKRKSSPTVFIDISVPRNVEPEVGKLEGVFLFNIDDLKRIAEENLKTRQREAQKGLLIVREEAQKFLKEWEKLKIGNLLKELKESVDHLLELSREEDPQKTAEIFKNRLLAVLFSFVKENPSEGQKLVEKLKSVEREIKSRQ